MTARETYASKSDHHFDGTATQAHSSQWLAVPEPIRRVFDGFPLRILPANHLPQRSPRRRSRHVLHIFKARHSLEITELSCNPACLKWQTYLKFNNIDFVTVPSNNHASPTGSLPFLLPAVHNLSRSPAPVPTHKMVKWVSSMTNNEDVMSMKQEAFKSLVDHQIRHAWLFTMYLDEDNFKHVAWPLYVSSASNSRSVHLTLAYQLRKAAQEELLKQCTVIDEGELYNAAADAFKALSVLLGDSETFSSSQKPDLFDASVFAYTHLLLDGKLGWRATRMSDELSKYENLVQHRHRLVTGYFKN